MPPHGIHKLATGQSCYRNRNAPPHAPPRRHLVGTKPWGRSVLRVGNGHPGYGGVEEAYYRGSGGCLQGKPLLSRADRRIGSTQNSNMFSLPASLHFQVHVGEAQDLCIYGSSKWGRTGQMEYFIGCCCISCIMIGAVLGDRSFEKTRKQILNAVTDCSCGSGVRECLESYKTGLRSTLILLISRGVMQLQVMPASMLFINRQPVGGSQDILPVQSHLYFKFLATTRFAIPLGPLIQNFL